MTSDLVTHLSCCCVLLVTSVQWRARLDYCERLSYQGNYLVRVKNNKNIGRQSFLPANGTWRETLLLNCSVERIRITVG